MDFWNSNVNFFNSLADTVNGLNTGAKQIWERTGSIIQSLDALKNQIDSLTKFVYDMQIIVVILLIALAIQFIVILVMWAGQSSINKELAEIKTAVKGQVKNE